MKKIEEKLQAISSTSKRNSRAHFCCALTLSYPSGRIISFQGKVLGIKLNFTSPLDISSNYKDYDKLVFHIKY